MFSDRYQRRRRFRQWVRWAALGLALVASTAVASSLQTDASYGGSPRLAMPPPDGGVGYTRFAAGEGRTRVTADFRSLGGDALRISFDVDADAGRSSMRAFGIAQDEIEALEDSCRRAAARCSQADLDQAVLRYYQDHHLRIAQRPGQRPRLFVDIPAVVRRNRDAVRPVAAALRELGSRRGGDAEWVVEAAVALVQAGLAYRQPSANEGGRQTLGFYTPARALEQGFGDCDTKSALLAAILADLGQSGLIGVRVPGHYLLGIARKPRPGEAFVEFEGRPYVLVEAAGPAARRPGHVSERTQAALDAREPMRIDPI